MPFLNASLVISIRPKAKWTFRGFILIRKNDVIKLHIFEDLLSQALLCPRARKLERPLVLLRSQKFALSQCWYHRNRNLKNRPTESQDVHTKSVKIRQLFSKLIVMADIWTRCYLTSRVGQISYKPVQIRNVERFLRTCLNNEKACSRMNSHVITVQIRQASTGVNQVEQRRYCFAYCPVFQESITQ
jgi:hypothetical protein